MCARRSSRTTRFPDDAGFSLTEALAVIAVGSILLAAFTGFYLSEQRAFRQQQVQVETSQSLRTALEEMVRDLRIAGRNPLGATCTAGTGTCIPLGGTCGITYADTDRVELVLDNSDPPDSQVDCADPNEYKGFRRNGSTIESYVAGAAGWQTLADWTAASGTIFRYFRGDGTEVTTLPASTADLAAIRRIDITLTMTRAAPGGGSISRTESASVRLRNLS